MYASGHFLIEQRLLAVEVLLRQRRARIGCDPLGRYLCSVTALDDGDRLSGADRITEPLEKPGDGTAGPRGHDSLAARDRKRVVYGKSVSVRVHLGGRRIIKKKKKKTK